LGLIAAFGVLSYVIEGFFVPHFDARVQKKKSKKVFDLKMDRLAFK